MEQRKKTFSSILKLFPGLNLWIRLPALIGWAAVSCGILTAFLLPLFKLKISPDSFYIIYSIIATISLLFAIICKNRLICFTGFFLFTLVFCTVREKRKSVVCSLLQKQSSLGTIHSICGPVVSSPVSTSKGYKFLIKTQFASFDTAGILKSKQFLCLSPVIPPVSGVIRVFGICTQAPKRINRYDFDEYTYLISNGVWGKMEIDSISIISNESVGFRWLSRLFREQVISVLNSFANSSHRAILQAAFLGEKEYLPPNVKTIFRKSGIYHLLAISGLHAGMLISASYLFLSLLPLSNNTKHILSLGILWLYLLFIGFLPSLFRATIMATFIIVTLLFQKKNYPLQSLGLAGIFWLVLSPESLFLPGYQLSFSATLGIITLSPVLNRFKPKISNPVCNYFFSKIFAAFCVSLSGFLSTAPILLYHFGTISLLGLVANLAAVFLMTLCMWSFFTLLLFNSALPFFSTFTIFFCELMLKSLLGIAQLAQKIPWSELTLPVPYVEITILCTLLLLGMAAIDEKFIRDFLKWGIPLTLILTPLSLLIRSNENSIKIVPFTGNNMSVTAVQFPHKGVWIFCKGKENSIPSIFKYSIRPWIRHNRGLYLEKIFHEKQMYSESHKIPEQLNEHQGTPDKSHYFRRRIRNMLFGAPPLSTCILTGNKIFIICGATWISLVPGDSTADYGTQDNPEKHRISIPTKIPVHKASSIKNSDNSPGFMYLPDCIQRENYETKNRKME